MWKRLGAAVLGLLVALLLVCGGSAAFAEETQAKTQIPFETVPVKGAERPTVPSEPTEVISPGSPQSAGSGWLGWLARNWGAISALGFGLALTYVIADAAGARQPRKWWERFTDWVGRKREAAQDIWESATDWLEYDAFPWVRYVAKAIGLYTAGFIFEATSGFGFGIGHLAMYLMGHNPDEIDDYYFQIGRMGGAKALEYLGYLEMLAGITGKGAGMLASATGIGASVGVPAIAVSAGLMAAGAGHLLRGNIAYRRAKEAATRTGGRSFAERPEMKLLSEEEIRKLLGPNASEQMVQRLKRFQEYAAEKMGHRIAQKRIRDLIAKEEGIGHLIESWVKELTPEQINQMLEVYTGRRSLLGAITEQRTAMKLAKDPNKIILKVNKHAHHGGADITYLDLVEKRLVIVEAKGSFAGRNVKPKLETIIAQEVQLRESAIYELHKQGRLTSEDLKIITGRLIPQEVSVVISTGGNASVSNQALADIARVLHIPIERVVAIPLD